MTAVAHTKTNDPRGETIAAECECEQKQRERHGCRLTRPRTLPRKDQHEDHAEKRRDQAQAQRRDAMRSPHGFSGVFASGQMA